MIEKAISAVLALLLAAGAVWWFNDRIRDYYQRPLIEAHAKVIALQKEAVAREIEALAAAKVVIKNVYVDRVKEIKVYEDSLTPDTACRADIEFVRLLKRADQR